MIFKLLLAVVVLAPMPFASVYPWSASLLAIAVGSLLVAWQIERTVKGRSLVLGLHSIWPLAVLFAFTVGWVGLQTVSFVPDAWKAPAWRQASEVLDITLAGSVSINPEATMTALMRLLTYAGVFWLSFQYCRNNENAGLAIRSIVLAGFFYALYGLWVVYSGSRMILWFDKFAYLDDLTSTFVNRNSYATYAGLGLICTTGLFIRMLSGPLAKPFGRSERFRQIIEDVLGHGWFFLVIWMLIMMALIMSHSRAGFLSTVLSLLVLSLVLSRAKGVRIKYALFLCGLSLAMIGFLFFFSGDALDVRFGMLLSDKIQRPAVYQTILDNLRDQPWMGTGYGTFGEAFQSLRGPDINSFFLMAHNTYLENATEMGLPAAISMFGIFAGFLYLTYSGIRTRHQGVIYPCIGFSATVLVSLHSLVDFSLQIPAVAITYSFIIGAACSQSWSVRSARDKW